MRTVVDEEKLIRHLEPKIERIVHKTLKEALPNELYYPPETMIKKSFIKRVLAAEKRMKKGEGKNYTYEQFKRKFLKGL